MILVTILVLSSILSVALTMSGIVDNGIIMGRTQVYSTKSYFAAESGIERLLWVIRKGFFDDGTCDDTNNKYVNFDNDGCDSSQEINPVGDAENYLIYTDDDPITFQAFGEYSAARRAVEIRYTR